jgi:LysM repeat protein
MLDKRRLLILVAALIGSVALAIALQAWLVSGPGELAASPIVSAEQVTAYRQGGDVWMADLEGEGRWRMTDNGDARDPALSPDGRWLAYVLPDQSEEKVIAQLWLADLQAGNRRLLAEGELPWAAPVWSPDGERIAWAAGSWVVAVPRSGRPQTLLREAQLGIAGRAQLAWAHDGSAVLAVLALKGDRGLFALPLKGSTRWLMDLDAAGPALLAVAPNSGAIAIWHEGALSLLADASGEAQPTALATDMLTPDVTEIAWWADGEGLLIATAFSGLWSGRIADWQLSPLPTGEQALAAAPVGALAARGDTVVLRQVIGAGDESLALVSPETGAIRWLTPPTIASQADAPACATCAGHEAAIRDYDWYRYQGASDSGPQAHNNCGPTSVAMAIQFATGQVKRISEVRDYIGGSAWTYASALQKALEHWGVNSRRLASIPDIDAAIRERGSVVLVHLWMNWITPGRDFQHPLSDPTLNSGRYYAYDQSHWVVLKGYSLDGQAFIVHDPNVWDGNGVYWHSNGDPKGRDRLYPYAQVAGSIAAYGYEAIEVFYDQQGPPPPAPTAMPTPTAQPKPASGFWYRVQKGDLLAALAERFGVSVDDIVIFNKIKNRNLIYIGQRLWIPEADEQPPDAMPTAAPATRTPEALLPTIAPTLAQPDDTTPTTEAPAATVAPTSTVVPTVSPPTPTPTVPSPDEGQWHTITYGDTLGQIAARYGISLDALLAANPDVNPLQLRIGQRVWVPVPALPGEPDEAEEPDVQQPTGEGAWHTVQPGDSLWSLAINNDTTVAAIVAANGIDANVPLKVGQSLWIPK